MKANVGMQYPVCAPVSAYTPGTSISYSSGSVVGEARGATLNWELEDGEFYGDDKILDTANGVLGYTLDFEPSGLSDAIRKTLLGETQASSEYTITDGSAPYVGFGYIRVMREQGTSGVDTTYEGWWFYRVQFSVSSEETRTKERSMEWRTPTLTGKGLGAQLTSDATLSFAVHESFTTFSAAKTWLNAKASIT